MVDVGPLCKQESGIRTIYLRRFLAGFVGLSAFLRSPKFHASQEV
jgi:hypothetical protein